MLNFLEIDECISNTCNKNATCIDTINSYACECKEGFTGDGPSCTGNVIIVIYITAKCNCPSSFIETRYEINNVYIVLLSYMKLLRCYIYICR